MFLHLCYPVVLRFMGVLTLLNDVPRMVIETRVSREMMMASAESVWHCWSARTGTAWDMEALESEEVTRIH